MKELNTKDILTSYVKKHFKEVSFSTAPIKSGFNHDIYKLTNEQNGKRLIAHIGRGTRDSGSSLRNSARVLSYLEYKKYNYTPRVISFDNKEDILIETYMEMEKFKKDEMSDDQLKTLARQLTELHSFSWREFSVFSKKHGFGTV